MSSRITALIARLFSPPALLADNAKRPRLYLLDAARGLAALAVIFWHYQHFFIVPGERVPVEGFQAQEPYHRAFGLLYDHGFLAVPIFWMISGFVFAVVYSSGNTTTKNFTVNRLARLYPLHILTLFVVAILQLLAVSKFRSSVIFGNNDPYHFILQIFFASSWGLENGYSFNAPIWSVSVEVLIYAIFWMTHRWINRFGILWPLTVGCGMLALTLAVPGNLILNCGFYFFFGVALCNALRALLVDRIAMIAAILGMTIAGALGIWIGSPVLVRLLGLPGLFGALILLLVAAEPALPAAWRKPLAAIGDNTYGMYLWHVPLQIALFLVLGQAGSILGVASSPWFLLLFFAAVIGVSRVAFLIFERPMRERLRRVGGDAPAAAYEVTAP